jgi:hypothetical protein
MFSKELNDRAARKAEQRAAHSLMMATAPPSMQPQPSPRRVKLGGSLGVSHMDGPQSARTPPPKGSAPFVESLVHELQKQLNRVSTVAAERMNEIVRLQQALEAANNQSEQAGDAEKQLGIVHRQQASQVKNLQRDLLTAQNRLNRAESLACSLEQQLRHVFNRVMQGKGRLDAESLVVDYGYYPDLGPSPMLLGVLSDDGARADRRKAKSTVHLAVLDRLSPGFSGKESMEDFLKGIDALTS